LSKLKALIITHDKDFLIKKILIKIELRNILKLNLDGLIGIG